MNSDAFLKRSGAAATTVGVGVGRGTEGSTMVTASQKTAEGCFTDEGSGKINAAIPRRFFQLTTARSSRLAESCLN